MADADSIIGRSFGHWQVLTVIGRRATCACCYGAVRVISVDALENGSGAPSCGCAPLTAAQLRIRAEEEAQRERRRDLRNWKPGSRRQPASAVNCCANFRIRDDGAR